MITGETRNKDRFTVKTDRFAVFESSRLVTKKAMKFTQNLFALPIRVSIL